MTAQLDMFASTTVPVPDNEDARVLFSVLKGRGWQHADVLVKLLNDYFPGEWDKDGKRLRDAAHAADGMVVSGPGSRGYCRVDECLKSKALAVGQTKIDQGTAMQESGIAIQRKAHAFAIRDEVTWGDGQ